MLICKVEGCGKHCTAGKERGLCNTHYNRLMNWGSTDKPPSRKRERKERKNKHGISSTKLRAAVLSLYGEKCGGCGFSDVRALQVDHPKGGGNQHRKRLSWSKLYREVLAHPEDYQLLCANCNWIKRIENKE